MSISVGGINLAEAAIDAQYRIAVLEKIVEHLVNRAVPGAISAHDIRRYQDQALNEMQRKYPNAGLKRNEP